MVDEELDSSDDIPEEKKGKESEKKKRKMNL